MNPGQYKRWVILGCISGLVAILLLVALTTQAFSADVAMTPRVSVIAVLVVLLGFLAISLIVGANICRAMCLSCEEHGQRRWWQGYSAAVEDLKSDGKIVDLVPRNARN